MTRAGFLISQAASKEGVNGFIQAVHTTDEHMRTIALRFTVDCLEDRSVLDSLDVWVYILGHTKVSGAEPQAGGELAVTTLGGHAYSARTQWPKDLPDSEVFIWIGGLLSPYFFKSFQKVKVPSGVGNVFMDLGEIRVQRALTPGNLGGLTE